MHDDAEAWFRQRTSHWRDWPLRQLMDWKHSQATRISVVIPARNEEGTVGGVITAVRDALMAGVPLVDELVVMDSDSTEETADVARRAAPRRRAPADRRHVLRRRRPCGGYKASGVGRQNGIEGLEQYLETKAIAYAAN